MLLLHVPKNCLIHLAILIQHWHAMHKQAKNRHINQETERVVVLESWSRGTSRTILSNLGLGHAAILSWLHMRNLN